MIMPSSNQMAKKVMPPANDAPIKLLLVFPPVERTSLAYTQVPKPMPSRRPISAFENMPL